MKGFLAVLGAVLLCAASADADPIAITGGKVRGQHLADGSTIYRALPYAAPPVGDLRFKPPAPVIPWNGIRHAVNAPRPCMQLNENWNAAFASAGSEDCLYLSLHVPKHKRGEKLPVFFWIHGGTNRSGVGFGAVDSALYKHGVIVVGIEYRLGVFGFLGADELAAETERGTTGNVALMDMIAALGWVKTNIAAFGGDANNVTIVGQSAGGVDVGLLMRSPLAKGLFHKAVQQSGAIGWVRSDATNRSIGRQLFTLLGLPPGPQGLAQLRAMPADQLLKRAAELHSPDGDADDAIWMGDTADGYVLTAPRHDAWRNGEQAAVPLMVGEMTIEVPLELDDGGRGMIASIYGKNAERALALYGFKGTTPPTPDALLGNAASQVATDLYFRCGGNRVAAWQHALGQPVYRYQFGFAEPGQTIPAHSADLTYEFGTPPKGASWPPLQTYFANFVKTGDPNGPGLPHWPEMGEDKTYLAILPSGIAPANDVQGPVCRVMMETFAAP